jgi:uncharacterized protein (TIGR00251 family)
MARRISVRVIPNAGRDEVVGWMDGAVLKVKLQAVPEDGRANRALCALLAARLGCRPREVRIVAGEKSRAKLVELPDGAAGGLDIPA